MAINLDLTVTLGSLIETGVIIIGGVTTLVTLRNTVSNLKANLVTFRKDTKDQFEDIKDETKQQFDDIKADTKERFDGIQVELKGMNDILIGMARFDERINNLDKRVTAQGSQIDELRHGEGFVRGHRSSIDGEYSGSG